ncbi:MAG: GxxExxY protein [Limisphaerales bacterium]
MKTLKPQRHEDTKNGFVPVSAEVERIAAVVVDSAFKVHSTLGPGLLESVYEICLAHELSKRGLKFRTQVSLPIVYDSLHLDGGLRIDLLVENQLVVELKAVEIMLPVFEAQLLTYLKLTGCRLGLLINFNVPRIKDGIKRIIL